MSVAHSAVYRGKVAHHRLQPKRHAFQYSVSWLYLDLDELEQALAECRWVSLERWNLASFRRKDYLGDASSDLSEAVRDRAELELGRRPLGPVRLLTQIRILGYVFNPVSFYYCFEVGGEELDCIVAEITNTPWGERYAYVMDARNPSSESDRKAPLRTMQWSFPKSFHVSPFFGMDHEYTWRFSVPQPNGAEAKDLESKGGPKPSEETGVGSLSSNSPLVVLMENRLTESGGVGQTIFEVGMQLERREWSARELRRALCWRPFSTIVVHLAIYWQALRLWLKRTPFFTHPDKLPVTNEIAAETSIHSNRSAS